MYIIIIIKYINNVKISNAETNEQEGKYKEMNKKVRYKNIAIFFSSHF